jgi:hypothetical protein
MGNNSALVEVGAAVSRHRYRQGIRRKGKEVP